MRRLVNENMEALLRIAVGDPDEKLDVYDFSDPYPVVKLYKDGLSSPNLSHYIVYDTDHVR